MNLSHYTLLEKIGEGGMGVVYRALDTRLHRHVAVKILRCDEAGSGQRERFLREARAAAAVTHPGIAVVHEIGEADDVAFIVMELVEGRSLGAVIAEGPMAIADVLKIAIQVADAMARAHAARIVHSDLKPDNIMIGDDLRARVLDFGLARLRPRPEPSRLRAEPGSRPPSDRSTQDLPSVPGLAGTVGYMSPEQVLGGELDARSDIFSFGATLYEMLAGRRAFEGSVVTATLAKILESHPEPLERLRPDLPAGLAAIVHRCLEKDRAARYESAADVASALREARRDPGAAIAAAGPSVSHDTIAVLPFSVRGGTEFAYLGAGLVDLLSTKLDGAGELRSVDPNVILCCPQTTAGAADPAGAAVVAARFGAGLFVLGSVLEMGGQLHLEASLYDAAGPSGPPALVSKASVRGAASGIFDMVDQLTSELLARRAGGPGSRLARIGAMATESFPALKAYLEGEAEMRAMRRVSAVEAYRRAVEQDPGFALAWYRLGVAGLWSGQSHIAHEAARRAVDNGSRLSERDRHVLEAFDAALRGDNEEAERRYRAILGAHPDDAEAWYQLGELLMHGGPLRGLSIHGSHDAWARLVQLDPTHVNGWAHLGLLGAAAGDTQRLESAMRRVIALSPTGDSASWGKALEAFSRRTPGRRDSLIEELRRSNDYTVAQTVWALAAYLGDHAAAHEVAGLLIEPVRSLEVRAMGHLVRAHLALAGGRWILAQSELHEAGEAAPAPAALHAAHLSTLPFVHVAAEALENLHERLERLAGHPPASEPRPAWIAPHGWLWKQLALYLLGLIELRRGRPEAALARAAKLDEIGGSVETGSIVEDLAAGLRARAAEVEGRDEEAVAIRRGVRARARFDLPIWSPFYSQASERWAMASLLERLGRHEEALRWLESFDGNSAYDQVFAAHGALGRARILERLGDAAAAAGQRARFQKLWGGCDPNLRVRS